MANLKPFSVEILHPDDTIEIKQVLAFNKCHAVNLVYRYLDSRGLLNVSRHGRVTEYVDFLSPNSFKDGQI